MSLPLIHPSSAQLIDFAQGRLSPAEQAEIEEHVAECDECCRVLAEAPNDSLLDRVRGCETFSVAAEDFDTEPPARVTVEVPKELVEHPRYRIRKVLGVGGMGVVFQAEHRLMERAVALKVINRALLSRPEFVERFEQEVKAAAKLAHPNIVVAHDAEQVGDLHFLVMEFVDGQSLAKIVERMGPLPVVNACHYIRQAAQGLQHAHEKGMVHRDIKPQNLMLTKRGQIKVLDFGLARLRQIEEASLPQADVTEEFASSTLTRAGSVLGTPDYMAPEQAADPRNADARSDIYSLGCTLYFLLTGRPPFAHESALKKLKAHQQVEMQPVDSYRDDVPAELMSVLERMVAKEPSARFQTAAEVVQAIAPLARATVIAPAKPELAPNVTEQAARSSSHRDMGETQEPLSRSDSADEFEEAPRAQRSRSPARRGRSHRRTSTFNWSDVLTRHHRRLIAGAIGVLGLLIGGNELRRWFASPTDTLGGTSAASIEDPSLSELVRERRPERQTDSSNPERVVAASRKRVGIALWSEGFVGPEYNSVRAALEAAGAQIVVISDAAQAESAWGMNEVVTVEQHISRCEAKQLDALVIVGGKTGVFRFFDSPDLRRLIENMQAEKKLIAGIGGGVAPLVKHGFASGHRVAVGREMQPHALKYGATVSDDPAVRDDLLITGRDAEAAAELARLLCK